MDIVVCQESRLKRSKSNVESLRSVYRPLHERIELLNETMKM